MKKNIALMVEAVSTSETSVSFYLATRRNIPEDSHLHTRRREKLKYHLFNIYLNMNFESRLGQCYATCVPPQGFRCVANFYKKLRIRTS
jgi:hypothetical protein